MIDKTSQQLKNIESRSAEAAKATVSVSVVIPCFNEGVGLENLAYNLKELIVENQNCAFEFLLVDDGSTDDTWEVLADHFEGWPECRLLRHETNVGLMAAIMTGTRAASNEIVCSMDSDCTYHPLLIPEMVARLSPGVAIVTGSPYHPEGQVRNVPNWRIWLSKFASTLYRRILRNKLYCYTSCFRVCRKSVVQDIELENAGFVGTTELIWRVEQLGDWTVVEMPATLNVRQFGQSKCRVAQVAWGHLKFMSVIVRARFRRSPSKEIAVVRQKN